jgi:hypothetical protein
MTLEELLIEDDDEEEQRTRMRKCKIKTHIRVTKTFIRQLFPPLTIKTIMSDKTPFLSPFLILLLYLYNMAYVRV